MSSIQRNQRGFSPVETLLIVIAIGVIGFVGWYVLHAKNTTVKSVSSTGNSSQTSAASPKPAATTAANTDDQSLQNDLAGINSADNQTTKDLNTSNSGLSDSSTFTSVPQ